MLIRSTLATGVSITIGELKPVTLCNAKVNDNASNSLSAALADPKQSCPEIWIKLIL